MGTRKPQPASRKPAFTLVELLVVVAIIVVLIALLVPGLEAAKSAAGRARCGANLHGVGRGLHFYLQEFKGTYPQIADWSGVMGNLGYSGAYQGNLLDTTARPLNAYLGYATNGTRVPIAECPSDGGDYLNGIGNCYEAWGNSYLPAYYGTFYRTEKVFGYLGGKIGGVTPDPTLPPVPSAKQRSFSPAYNKMVMADWPWHANRQVSNIGARWHTGNPERLYSVLFADSHAEVFMFPIELEAPAPGGDVYGLPQRSAKWW